MSAASTEPVWHYTSQNQRKGPVTLENLQTLVSRGRLDLQKDMVWNPEMPEWTLAGSVQELAKVKVDPTAAPAAKPAVAPSLSAPAQQAAVPPAKQPKKPEKVAESTSPYQTPRAQGADTGELEAAMKHRSDEKYPGVGRLGYVIYPLFTLLLIYPLSLAIAGFSSDIESPIVRIILNMGVLLVLLIGLLYPTFGRFTNLRMSGWYFWLLFVPIANLWVGYRLFACPPGYGEHKKMDVIGWILATLYGLVCTLHILGVVLYVTNDEFQREFDESFEKGYQEELQRQREKQGR
ncbi:protein of unknown function [Rubritalea squalenifaciens DSM 18772]|uniref:GYF domain-containing protein n=1 Tax=Rubritalea squalenifaciens DSM 18772 TaxID=1123071 RepID=A0A1M6LG04_9BACT|nr:DUF4339 domain-containing protein [Rubritalea squalenifaciens]SHJ70120.1 protein of unknown function [Rubritalea squalenifaciens DSM 18772]